MTSHDKMIAELADQLGFLMTVGNAMIDGGNNSSVDHHEAWEMFAKHYSANGGGCAGLRALAKAWKGDRASYLMLCEQHGINKATAATQWGKGRKA
jgi:hypothetical protein